MKHYFRGFGGRQTPYFSISRAGLRAKPVLAARSTRQALARPARSRVGGRKPGAVPTPQPAPTSGPAS